MLHFSVCNADHGLDHDQEKLRSGHNISGKRFYLDVGIVRQRDRADLPRLAWQARDVSLKEQHGSIPLNLDPKPTAHLLEELLT